MSELTKYSCAQAFGRLDDYLDRELTTEEMALVKGHLKLCTTCAMEFDFEASVLETVKEKIRRVDLPEDLLAKVLRALEDA